MRLTVQWRVTTSNPRNIQNLWGNDRANSRTGMSELEGGAIDEVGGAALTELTHLSTSLSEVSWWEKRSHQKEQVEPSPQGSAVLGHSEEVVLLARREQMECHPGRRGRQGPHLTAPGSRPWTWGCPHKWDGSRGREPVWWVQYLSPHWKCMAWTGAGACPCHPATTRTDRGPRSCIWEALGNILPWADPVTHRDAAEQHPGPKRDQKHFLL